MEANKMKEELSELKTGHELLKYRADQTDKVITKLSESVDKLHKDIQPIGEHLKWLTRLGIFYVVADTLGVSEAIKVLVKMIGV